MTSYEFDTFVSETKLKAYETKAIAEAFSRDYIESSNYHLTAEQIEADPDSFVYLFSAMYHSLYEVCERLAAMEDKTNEECKGTNKP